MRRGVRLLTLALVACVTPYDELPLCGLVATRDLAPSACAKTKEAKAYREQLANEVLRRSQWEYPPRLPLRVQLDPGGRVGGVCVGSQKKPPGWNTRDRVASSLRALRAAPPAPACLAGTTVDLTRALMDLGVPPGTPPTPIGMTWCDELRDSVCANRMETVCAVYDDGRRRTYPNACDACRNPSVVGYLDFTCR